MRHVFYFLLSFLAIACSALPSRNPAATQRARHIIITVHGISGNEQTWGEFAPATKQYLEKVDPRYEVLISNFLYPTGRNENLTTFDFAEKLAAHINALFDGHPPDPADKISLVAHSQGGIVSYIWFFSQLIKGDLRYVRKVDSIITLGTPFWGSKLASIFTDDSNIDIIPFVKAFGGPNFLMTRREIEDMAFGSDTVQDFRRLAIQLDSDPTFADKLKSLPVRLVNISGVLPLDKNKLYSNLESPKASKFASKMIDLIYSMFIKEGAVASRVETDIAVIVPSARWDFIYTSPKMIAGPSKIQAHDFRQFKNLVNRSKFLFSETVHLPFDAENTLSMAYINRSCLQVETCNHPTYRYILEELANCKADTCDNEAFVNIIQKMKVVNLDQHKSNLNIQSALRTFNIQFGIKLNPGQLDSFPVRYFNRKNPSGDGDPGEWVLNELSLIGKVIDLKRDKKQISMGSNANQLIHIGNKLETKSIDVVSKPSSKTNPYDQLRVTVTGTIQFKKTSSQYGAVPLEINLPGLPKVEIEALVRPGYSTYFELDYRK